MSSPILWLRERFTHMGQYSGYDQLCTTLEKEHPNNYQSVWCDRNKTPRGLGRLVSGLISSPSGNPLYTSASALAELKTIWQTYLHPISQIHILYIEDAFRIIGKKRTSIKSRIIATVHQPPGWWRSIHCYPEELEALDELIVLSNNSVEYFDKYLPGRVHFIPHGVDTEFFSPDSNRLHSSNLECIFVGQWLRDLETLVGVVDRVLSKNPAIHFNIVIPHFKRHISCLQRMARHTQVRWYANLSDQALRDLYRRSHLLVLPLLDCTANNALLEASACGLPVITNAFGGAFDYTQPTFAELLPVGDVVGMSDAILAMAENLDECQKRGAAARCFVEANFTWQKVAEQVFNLYSK